MLCSRIGDGILDLDFYLAKKFPVSEVAHSRNWQRGVEAPSSAGASDGQVREQWMMTGPSLTS